MRTLVESANNFLGEATDEEKQIAYAKIEEFRDKLSSYYKSWHDLEARIAEYKSTGHPNLAKWEYTLDSVLRNISRWSDGLQHWYKVINS